MKRVFVLLLTFSMLLSLVACGGKEENDPNAGIYLCTTAEMMGMEMPIEDIYEGENTLELKSGGKGTITLESDPYKIKWTLDGTELTISIDGEDSVGTLKNGVIKIDFMNMGLVMTFVKEGATEEQSSAGDLAGSLKDKLDGADSTEVEPEAASELGLYYGTTYEYNDQIFTMTDIYNSLCSLELLEGGKAIFILGDETIDATWALEGEEFVLTHQYVDSSGTLTDGVITINFMGIGVIMTFEQDGESAPATPAATEKPEKTTGSGTKESGAKKNGSKNDAADENIGILDYDTIAEVYDWVLFYSSKENNYGKAPYEEIVERMGGVEGAPSREDLWNEKTRYYRWGVSEEEHIQLTFRLNKENIWEHCGSTNTTMFMDIYNKYYG